MGGSFGCYKLERRGSPAMGAPLSSRQLKAKALTASAGPSANDVSSLFGWLTRTCLDLSRPLAIDLAIWFQPTCPTCPAPPPPAAPAWDRILEGSEVLQGLVGFLVRLLTLLQKQSKAQPPPKNNKQRVQTSKSRNASNLRRKRIALNPKGKGSPKRLEKHRIRNPKAGSCNPTLAKVAAACPGCGLSPLPPML